MASKYFNFIWKIGVMLVSEVGPVFVGGRIEYSFNIDSDHLSIPELVDIAKDFGVTKLGTTYIAPSKGGKLVKLEKDKNLLDLGVLLNDGDTIDIFICNDSNFEDVGHVGQHVNVEKGGGSQLTNINGGSRESEPLFIPHPPIIAPAPTIDLDLEICSTRTRESPRERAEESCKATHSRTVECEREEENTGFPSSLNTSERAEKNIREEVDAASGDFQKEGSASGDLNNSSTSSEEDAGTEEEFELSDDYGSDVHEELRVVKQDLKAFKVKKAKKSRKERPDGFLGEAGLDEGYDDIDKERKNLKDKLGGDDDEPYYDSSEADSFASESEGEAVSDDEVVEENLRVRIKSNGVVYDPSCEKVIWEIGQVFENVKEFREALTKYVVKKGVQL
ncbi:hypothetical protein A4A49_55557, partial [Nicotiana attenuata]